MNEEDGFNDDEHKYKKKIVSVGNSRGIRLSKKDAPNLDIGDEVEFILLGYDKESMMDRRIEGWHKKYDRISYNVFCGLVGDSGKSMHVTKENFKKWEELNGIVTGIYELKEDNFRLQKEKLVHELESITTYNETKLSIEGYNIPGMGPFVELKNEKKLKELTDIYYGKFTDEKRNRTICDSVESEFRKKTSNEDVAIVNAVIRNVRERHTERLLQKASWCGTLNILKEKRVKDDEKSAKQVRE